MIKKEVQAVVVIFIVLAMGLVYVGHQTSGLQGQVNELQGTTDTIVGALRARVNELENLIVECGIEIDNGTKVTTETVYLTKGAAALEALRRVAVVEVTYYPGLGEFIDSINGISNDLAESKYWMWHIWENGTWTLAPVSAGNYKLSDGENILFRYEVVSW
jgi:hypothetical protein